MRYGAGVSIILTPSFFHLIHSVNPNMATQCQAPHNQDTISPSKRSLIKGKKSTLTIPQFQAGRE